MKKINIGIFGPEGIMGKDIISRIDDYDSLKISSLCERKNHPSIGKKVCDCIITDNIKEFVENSDVTFKNRCDYSLHIVIAPPKNPDRINWIIEKSVEMGASRVSFITSERSIRNKIKLDRL